MEDLEKLKAKLKEKQKDLAKTKKDDIFKIVEIIDGRKIYHTKVFSDFYNFGRNKKYKHKFYITLRGLFNTKKTSTLNLFALKEGDKFLGIFYGYKYSERPIIVKNVELNKSFTIRKPYYIEFRFKNGSVFCFLKSFYSLLKNYKNQKEYDKVFLDILTRIEKEVYEFYCKKLPEGGKITRWIEKKQK